MLACVAECFLFIAMFQLSPTRILLLSTSRDVDFVKDVDNPRQRQFLKQFLTLQRVSRGSCLCAPEHMRLFAPSSMWPMSPASGLLAASAAQHFVDSQATARIGRKALKALKRMYNTTYVYLRRVTTFHHP